MRYVYLAMLILFAAPTASADNDHDKINALFGTWRTAVESSDIASYVSVLHPDVKLLPPGAAPIIGRDAYAKFLEPVFESATYKIEVRKPPKIEVLADAAIAEYEYVIHLDLKEPESEITEPGAITASRTVGRYLDVLRKGKTGEWLV